MTKFLHNVNNPTFLTKFLHNVNNPVSASFGLIYQCDSCPKFRKYPYLFIAAAMMVGKRMPISSFSHVTLQKILQLYWPITLLSFVQRQVVWSYIGYIRIMGKLIIICVTIINWQMCCLSVGPNTFYEGNLYLGITSQRWWAGRGSNIILKGNEVYMKNFQFLHKN